MVAPSDIIAAARQGRAELEVKLVSRESAVTSAYATSPMKLLTPRARGVSAWACTSSFGGGHVAGDQTRLDIHIGPGARCYLSTQASTKVYRNPTSLPSGHETRATLDAGSLLVLAPDPVQPFAGSTYTQRQTFCLAPDASLVLLDWFTSGRAARGERWAFSHFSSRNEVVVRTSPPSNSQTCAGSETGAPLPLEAGKLRTRQPGSEVVLLDSMRLDPADGLLDSHHRTARFNCLATLFVFGPLLRNFSEALLAALASRPVERRAGLVCSASPIRDGALLRVAGAQVQAVAHEIHQHLTALAPLLGEDPWTRKG